MKFNDSLFEAVMDSAIELEFIDNNFIFTINIKTVDNQYKTKTNFRTLPDILNQKLELNKQQGLNLNNVIKNIIIFIWNKMLGIPLKVFVSNKTPPDVVIQYFKTLTITDDTKTEIIFSNLINAIKANNPYLLVVNKVTLSSTIINFLKKQLLINENNINENIKSYLNKGLKLAQINPQSEIFKKPKADLYTYIRNYFIKKENQGIK